MVETFLDCVHSIKKNLLLFLFRQISKYSIVLDDGKFCYTGSSGAANSGFGMFNLPEGSTELSCEGFWFSDIKEGTETEIGYYHNTSGNWNAGDSEELSVSNDEFWEMEEELLAQVQNFEMISFAEYKNKPA